MDKIIIYGAGNMGKAVFDLLKSCCDIQGFLDGNSRIDGTTVMGIPVYSPSSFVANHQLLDITVLVAMTVCPFTSVKAVLANLGFEKIVPAGDYVASMYTEYPILNTWTADDLQQTIGFSDVKSTCDYDAACEWFMLRSDRDWGLVSNKYFPEFLNKSIAGSKVMVDTAALNGEYIDAFLKNGSGRSVYAHVLTPMSIDIDLLRAHYKAASVHLFMEEAADTEGFETCQRVGLMQPFTEGRKYKIKTTKIDTAMQDIPFDYLRCYSMSETLPVLRGAEKSICKYRPVIAVNISHYQSDFVNVPPYLNAICPDYRFYFRMHSYQGNDCILYAAPMR